MQHAKRFNKSILGMLLALMVMFTLVPLSAFAEDLSITTTGMDKVCAHTLFTSEKDKNFDVVPNAKSTDVTKVTVFKCTGSALTFSKEAFDNGTAKSRKQAMANFVTALQGSNMEDQHQQYVIDKLSAEDSNISRMLIPLVMDSTSADLYTALKWMSPFLPIVRVIFGIGAIVIALLLIGSTIIDLCFIGLPIMRESMNNKAEGKGGKIPLVSSDAVSVIKETESSSDSSGGYKNAYLVYFGRRAVTYVILSICLLYLVLGELSGLISWLLSLGDGIVGGS